MGLSFYLPAINFFLPLITGFFLLVLIIERSLHRRSERRRKSAELRWFSELQLLSKGLSETLGPEQVGDEVLGRTLAMLEAQDGSILLQLAGPEGGSHTRGLGLSDAAIHQLSGGALRSYLLSSGERWGSLMVFPDISKAEALEAWNRDALFHELRLILTAEGLRTLLLVGLQVRGKSYGVLLVGSRRMRTFQTEELRVLLAIGNQVSVALENWSLHRAAERHGEELRILQRVGRQLRETFNIKAQIQILRTELKGLLGSANFSLSLQDSPEGPLQAIVPFEFGPGASPLGPRAGTTLAEHIVRTRAPLLLDRGLPEAAYHLGIASVEPRLRTWCGLPIHFSDGSMGVLAIADFERERAIDERQFELIQILANEAAGAIENARLFQKEQRRARHLALLNDLGRKASAVLNPQELLGSICEQIRSAFEYDLARIELLDRKLDELHVEAEAGYGSEILGRSIRLGEGLSGAAAESGEAVLANSAVREARYVPLDPGVRSALSLPLKYRGDLTGVLSLESRSENAFSPQDVTTLRTLADQLAIALHNARAYQVALEQAITDGLTGLKTHRYFMEALDSEWRRSTRAARKFSLIMMDLDRFKRVNDRHGHLEGDRVLGSVARLIDARSRGSNIVARYGGDEFVILIPEAGPEQAAILAERLRASVAADPFLSARGVTASFGLSTFPLHGPTQEEILRVADAGMYLAKHEDGNRVRMASVGSREGAAEWEQQLLEAYLGVAVKRMFSTGPEAFNQYLRRFEQVTQAGESGAPSVLDTVTALAFAIDAKDHYTQGHSQAVSRLAAQIAKHIGLSAAETEEIRLAGILHDVGKIGVPESVLNKPSRLTSEEYELMKSHAALGAKILEPLKVKTVERIRRMVRHHHECFDGGGYPDQLKGEDIPLGARILTVADCFDTMVSERAYKKGRSIEEALAELHRCSGTQLDPALVAAFAKSIETFGDPRKRAALEAAAN